MLWTVLLGREPMAAPWSVGDLVTARLHWCDSPNLPDDIVMRDVDLRAEVLRSPDGQPWAQVVRAGAVAAARPGHHEAGEVRLSGCLAYDGYLQSSGQVPVTSGVVRRIRVMLALHDRGTDRWIPHAGAVRLRDVPDAAVNRLRDEPSLTTTAPEKMPELGTLVFLSADQYFERFRDRLPAYQWQAQGFVVDLAVPPASTTAADVGPADIVNSLTRLCLDADPGPSSTTTGCSCGEDSAMSVTRRRLTRLGAICALAITSLIVVLPAQSASADPAPGPVKFVLRYDNRCLEADLAHITTNGDQVQVWDCYADPGNQEWEIEPTGAVYHGLPVIKLVNIAAGKCLESDLSHSGNATPVQLWDCWTDPGNQQWQRVTVRPTIYSPRPGERLVNVLTGQCLDIDLAHITSNGARAQLWGCWNDPGNERFIVD